MGRCLPRFVCAAVALLVAGAGMVQAEPSPLKQLQTPLQSLCQNVALGDAELTVWSASGDVTDLSARLRTARIAVLGEIHDNATHHLVQACLIEAFAQGRKPAVVWEQFNESQSASLQAYWSKRSKRTAPGLGAAVGWAKSGWPAWAMYQPIAEIALLKDLPMYAGNADRQRVMQVARQGLGALPVVDRTALKLENALPDGEAKALLGVLAESHCGLMPASAFGAMAKAQNLRDAWMAREASKALKTHGAAALVTGNGHVHRFRGVPLFLEQQNPGLKSADVITVMVVETDNPSQAPASAVPVGAGANVSRWAADFVIATRPAEREDPCIAMRKRFGKK